MKALAELERRVETATGAVGVLCLALVQFAFVSIALPVIPGRDFGDYLWVYLQLGDWHSTFPMSMLFRTPVAPVLVGGPLELAGGWGLLVTMAFLFGLTVLAWTRVALAFGARAAVLVATALLLFPGLTILFHQPSSNPVLAFTFALLALALTRAFVAPSLGRFAVLGLAIAATALTRPENQALIALTLVPAFLRLPLRRRLLCAGACAGVALAVLAGWAANNGLRYGDYTVARRGTAYLPFFRAFTTDHIVSASNGPASRELVRMVETELLGQQPYRAYHVTTEAFFTRGKDREFADLLSLSDRDSWSSNYSVLFRAGLEAVRTHPGAYASGVTRTVAFELWHPLYVALPTQQTAATSLPSSSGGPLPVPSEGELVPSSHQGAYLATPDNRIHEVWTSPAEHHLVFASRSDRTRYEQVQARTATLASRLPPYRGSRWLRTQLSRSSGLFPPAMLWLAAGVVGIALRRPRNSMLAVLLAAAGLAVVLVGALADYSIVEFALPVIPAFVTLGVVGLVGARRDGRELGESSTAGREPVR